MPVANLYAKDCSIQITHLCWSNIGSELTLWVCVSQDWQSHTLRLVGKDKVLRALRRHCDIPCLPHAFKYHED